MLRLAEEESLLKHRKLLVALGAAFAILLVGFGGLCYWLGGPRDAYGFLRYALPQWKRGDLRVGDRAPDARLVSLDGRGRFHLRDRIGATSKTGEKRPLVLVFGSYT